MVRGLESLGGLTRWPAGVGGVSGRQRLEGSPCLLTTLVQTCLVCRKGDNDEFLLLCDGCDRGCHIYCLRPKMEAVPEGDWFCAVCLAQVSLLLPLIPLPSKSQRFSFSSHLPPVLQISFLPCLSLSWERAPDDVLGDLSSDPSLDKSLKFYNLTCFYFPYKMGMIILSLSPTLLGYVNKFTCWLMHESILKPQSHLDK